jgi:hypothetical protein
MFPEIFVDLAGFGGFEDTNLPFWSSKEGSGQLLGTF